MRNAIRKQQVAHEGAARVRAPRGEEDQDGEEEEDIQGLRGSGGVIEGALRLRHPLPPACPSEGEASRSAFCRASSIESARLACQPNLDQRRECRKVAYVDRVEGQRRGVREREGGKRTRKMGGIGWRTEEHDRHSQSAW